MHNYFKSTETCWCLPSSSNHMNHCKKIILFTLVERICTIVENKQHKLRHLSESKETLQEYDYPDTITNGIKKALEIPKMKLKNQKKNKQMKFYHLFQHVIQIIYLYITQFRILLKLLRKTVFQNLKASNASTVIDNHLILKNCWLKRNLAMKKQVLKSVIVKVPLLLSKEYTFKKSK